MSRSQSLSWGLPCLLAALPAARLHCQNETLLLQSPTISKDHIVFTYARDLWVTGRQGGDARRLTSSPGNEVRPHLSPDGKWVAFSGDYDGNIDVYLIPVEGGNPKRLTWHPGQDLVTGWHPDGKRILFSSGRASGVPAHQLYHVSVTGGMPVATKIPRALHGAWNKAGTRIAYTPYFDAFRTWKRYRGGRTTPVWIYDPATHEVEQVPHVNASDTFPSWAGNVLYFASDRDGVMNVWRYTPAVKELEQMTRFSEFHVRNLDADETGVVFEQGGALSVLDPKTNRVTRLVIRCRADGLAARPRWQAVKGQIRSGAVAPNGKRAVFEARGEILSAPRQYGDVRNLSSSPGANDRSPIYSPDGKRVAWFSDATGEYQLVVADHRGRNSKSYELDPRGSDGDIGGFYYAPAWSRDGKSILFRDKTNRIAFVTLESGAVTEVSRSKGSLGVIQAAAVWSPDSKWICYEKRNPVTTYDRLYLYDVEKKTSTQLTDDFGAAGSPTFSLDGKYLYFQASVDSGPRRFGLDMSASAARRSGSSIYCVVLKKDGKHPLAPRSDEAFDAKPDAKPPAKKAAKKADKKAKVVAPSIDLAGIDQRIVSLPLKKKRYAGLVAADSALLLASIPASGPPILESFSLKTRKATTIASGIQSVNVAPGGKFLLMQTGGRWAITNTAGKDAKSIAIADAKVRVVPEQEWQQILREVWRIERDYFYDPAMHGIDWSAMWARWQPFVKHVKHRSDLNVVISEMIGELCCGHEYVRGGQVPAKPTGAAVGLLGADIGVAGDRYRIAKILEGQNWNPGLRAPLTEPGVDARNGDYVLSIDGTDVRATRNFYSYLEGRAGRQVELVLSANADGSKPRTMTVVPIKSEGSLRQRSWVEANRERVRRRSKGRLAYIYMPNTGAAGQAAFDRDFYSQLDKQGLVLDERYNGGGKVADYVIDVLSRKVRCYWMNREQWLSRTPFGVLDGPKVMVINELAGSGGDAMPWLFQQAGIGPLVGTRTWGGLVGLSGYPPLMDGGSVTAASFGVMDRNGDWAVENVGVSPDHEVIEWPKPIIEGGDPQLDKAIDVALELLAKRKPRKVPVYKPPARR